MTDRLHCIRMERDAVCTEQCPDLCNGLNAPNLVIRRHDRNEYRILPERRRDIRRIDAPRRVYRQIGNGKPAVLHRTATLEHRMMFNGRGNDVRPLPRSAPRLREPPNRPVVALRAAAREENLFGQSPNERRCLFPCTIDTTPRKLTKRMQARRVSVNA